MSAHLGVELGSARTRMVDTAGRVLFDEPTAAAVSLRDSSLVAFGSEARRIVGNCAGEVGLVRPVVHGQLQDLALTDRIAEHLLKKAGRPRRPQILVAVPGLATPVQKRALERSFKKAGAGEVEFIEQAVAAGIGFGLQIEEPIATMVVVTGAGTTDAAVMALGGVVTEESLPLGGDDLDAAVRELCLRSFDLVVSPYVARHLVRELAAAWPGPEEKREVLGRDASNGMARTVVISSSEVGAAVSDIVKSMVAAVVNCLVTAPPDLANDLLSRGLHLAGGGSLLEGLARRLANDTGVPVHLAAEPERAAVVGAARCLRELYRPSSRRVSDGDDP